MSLGRKRLLDLEYTVLTIERHAIYITSYLVRQSRVHRETSTKFVCVIFKAKARCLISKLTSKRNITLIFGVPFAKPDFLLKSHCQNLRKLENSFIDTPDTGEEIL